MKKLTITIFTLLITLTTYAQHEFQQELTKAQKGDIEAIATIGMWYYMGTYTSRNDIEAFKWLKLAADKGYTKVYSLLGIMYYTGRGTIQDYSQALAWGKKAAECGDQQGYYLYGRMKGLGQGCDVDYKESIFYLQKAAESGNPDASSAIGSMYFYGKGVIKDYAKAYTWLKAAADKNDRYCTGELAYMLYYGKGTSVNYTDAKRYAEKAANNGDFLGHRIMSLLYIYGYGVEPNQAKAFQHIDKALELSHNGIRTLDVKGELYAAIGNREKATEIYQEILSKDADFYTKQETVLSKFIKEHSISDVDTNIYTSKSTSPNTFALIISNENYRKEATVPFAGNDGKIFEEYCKKTLGIPASNVHMLADATLNDIRHEVKWLRDIISVYNGEAQVIFYYAGHGIPDEKNKNAYLLPVDGYGSDVTTGFALDDLYKTLGSLPSKSVTIFLDACFSGANRNGEMLASARGVAIKAKASAPMGNMVIFTAAQGDETAYPYKEQGHGLFTYYLLKKLQDTKGDATLGELGDYIQTQVRRQSVVTNGKLQSPSVLTSPAVGNGWKEWKLK